MDISSPTGRTATLWPLALTGSLATTVPTLPSYFLVFPDRVISSALKLDTVGSFRMLVHIYQGMAWHRKEPNFKLDISYSYSCDLEENIFWGVT